MIQRRYYPDVDLIVHVATGELDVEEFREAAAALYQMDPIPMLSLWDLRDCSLAQMTTERIVSVQSGLSSLVRGRAGGRTAVVVPADLSFGIVRQYLTYSEDLGLPFEQEAFRTMDAALDWLEVDARLLRHDLP